MRFVDRGLLALLALLIAAPSIHAAKCTDTSGFEAAMDGVEAAVPCTSATKHKKYVKDAKRALGSRLAGPCKKAFVKRFLENSTCGRSGFEVCCDANKKGKDISKVVKAGKCKGEVCTASRPQSVGEGCTASGTCIPTTTTTTTSSTSTSSSMATTTTTTSSTTTSTECTLAPELCPTTTTTLVLEFTTRAAGGTCGQTLNGTGGVIKTLTCGGLSVGGGGSIAEEGPTPDGATNRFSLSCTGSSCTIGPFTTPPAPNSADVDCSTTGCNFGTPLEIPNMLAPALTTCVLNTWSAEATGTLDLASGASSPNVALSSAVFITGDAEQPCPRCSAAGSPGAPGTGTCDRGPNLGQPCTSTNSRGLSRDCPTAAGEAGTPGFGTAAGVLAVNLSPLTTGPASMTSDAAGIFCPGQIAGGCFSGAGSTTCRRIEENGSPAGPMTPGTPANATIASVFCIPATSDALVNASAKLPGPGALSLPGTFVVK
jgi:hypothetical protein